MWPTWSSPATSREEIGLLIFPTPQAQALPPGELGGACRPRPARHPGRGGGGSSPCPTRALILDEPPSVDAGEITDKGYINQRAVLTRRANQVLALYAPGGVGAGDPALTRDRPGGA